MKNSLRILLTLLPLLYMAAIWIMSGMPADAIIELPDRSFDSIFKESLHLIEFAILYMLFAAALAANGLLTPSLSLIAAIVACLYGVTDEIHQSFVPYRSATLIDVVKDVIGVLAAYFHVRFHYFNHKRGFLTRIEKLSSPQKN